jgi:uncharacterized membrane protein YpjA
MVLVEWLGGFKRHLGWAATIALTCVVGIAYGFWYYTPQFRVTPFAYWPFVPDSPLAVLWGLLALAGYWLTRARLRETDAPRWLDALDALAWVGNVQVGLWTVYVLVVYADSFGTYTLNLNTVLLAAHAGMVALGAIFLAGLRARVRADRRRLALPLGVAAGYYLINDALDYFGPDFRGRGCGLRPYTVPCDATLEPLLTGVTFGLTVVSLLVLAAVIWPARARGPVQSP